MPPIHIIRNKATTNCIPMKNPECNKDSENFGSILANAGFVGHNFSFGLKAGVFSPSPDHIGAVPKTNSTIK